MAVNCCVLPAAIDGEAGVTAIETKVGVVPVPDSVTSCGLLPPLSLTVSVAFRAPVVLGVNVTEIVQLEPAASVAGLTGQLLVAA